MISEQTIKERFKKAVDADQRNCMNWLRLVVANFINGDQGDTVPKLAAGEFGEVTIHHWEEGRYNPVANNTQVTMEGLTFNKPDFTWTKIPSPSGRSDIFAAARKGYYFWLWDNQDLDEQYRYKILDMLTLGEANMGCFVRGDGIEVEWCDAIRVSWDPAYKDPAKRRYVFYDKTLPQVDALRYYPELDRYVTLDDRNRERELTVTCFWDREDPTEAVLYRNDVIRLRKNQYGNQLPIRATVLGRLPGVKYAQGVVERQLGSHELLLRIHRDWRDRAVSGPPIGVAAGFIEDQYRALEGDNDGQPRILRSNNPQASFKWATGPQIEATAIQVEQLVMEHLNAESGTTASKRGMIDQNLDFASQLGIQAMETRPRDRFLSQRMEEGMKDDITQLIMPIAQQFEARSLRLNIGEYPIEFGPMQPINPLLGSDGELLFKPGGMSYRSSAQKLQESMIFANVLALAASLPPGTQERFVRMALDAAEVEDPEAWIADMQAAQAQIAEQQMMMAQMQMEAQARGENVKAQQGGASGGQPGQGSAPQAKPAALPQPAAGA